MNREDIYREYKSLLQKYVAVRTKLQKQSHITAWLRLLVFSCAIASLVILYGGDTWALAASIIVLLVVFLFLLRHSSVINSRITFYSNLITINELEIRAMEGDNSGFHDGSEWIDPSHDFSVDTDLFGKNSLFSFLNRTVTGMGREILAGWLSDPVPLASSLTLRQEAVRELSAEQTWRQHFMAYCMESEIKKEDVEGINSWLADNRMVIPGFLSTIYTRFLPALTIITLLLVIGGIIPFNVFSVPFIINLIITALYLRNTNTILLSVAGRSGIIRALERAAASFESKNFSSELLRDIALSLRQENKPASESLRQFVNIIRAFDSRNNIFVGLILNGLIMWDMQYMLRLIRWKRENSEKLPEWIHQAGITDALISLANLSYNNPRFCFPEVSTGDCYLEAVGVAHPLINEKKRITNDFIIRNKGTITVITGANMAGKSTFLRTISVNLILAMTGAPVCAERFRFTPASVFTSMRNTDSLNNNESFFYAELLRLKTLKERSEAGEEIIFFLDEIMKGTNSEDKSAGSKLFIRKLIASGVTGLVATHDLTLGSLENEYSGIIENKCFEVYIDGDELRFDFKLRDGMTTTMNAVILMHRLGLA